MPLAQALIDAHGWRDALVILAVILAMITVPLHALVLREAPPPTQAHLVATRSRAASDVLRSQPFWLLSGAFFLATAAGIAMMIHAIAFLLERGYGSGFAAFAVGLVGVSQVPGRMLFGLIASRIPPEWSSALVFTLIAIGIAIVVSLDTTATVLVGLVVLGMGNGMATLARATVIADLFGTADYGTIASVAALTTTGARAAGPFAAAVYAAAVGYDALLWTLVALSIVAAALAYRAELQARIQSARPRARRACRAGRSSRRTRPSARSALRDALERWLDVDDRGAVQRLEVTYTQPQPVD